MGSRLKNASDRFSRMATCTSAQGLTVAARETISAVPMGPLTFSSRDRFRVRNRANSSPKLRMTCGTASPVTCHARTNAAGAVVACTSGP